MRRALALLALVAASSAATPRAPPCVVRVGDDHASVDPPCLPVVLLVAREAEAREEEAREAEAREAEAREASSRVRVSTSAAPFEAVAEARRADRAPPPSETAAPSAAAPEGVEAYFPLGHDPDDASAGARSRRRASRALAALGSLLLLLLAR